jgi:hypothetical protein
MLKHHMRYLSAAGIAVAAGTIALTSVAAGASVAGPAHTLAPDGPAAPHSAAALPRIDVTMNGKKITVSGALQSGGVRIVSAVTHERQGNPIFVRLDPGVTLKQLLAVLPRAAADPNNLDGIASIVVDVQVSRGATSTVQANLKAGQYVALDVAGHGRPPLIPFTIAKATHPAALPRPAATIAAIEFGFRGPGRLHQGDLVRFANHGFLVHMIVFATAANHRQARKVARFLKEGKQRKAQRHATGFGTFAGPLSHGAYQQLVVRHRGWYVLACFMQTQDGRDHVRLGMERVIHVVK